jgi:hypothetical protein
MAERQIKRNSRGQIVSYEIAAINDPTVATPEYGKFLLQGPNEEGTVIEKYSSGSFNEEINTDITLELVTSDTIIDTQIVLNEIITTQDQRATNDGGTVIGSIDTAPFGEVGLYINEYRVFTRTDGK